MELPFKKLKLFKPKSEAEAALLDHDFSRLNYTIIDCEMTGLNPKQDHLLSIGAVKVINGNIHLADSFYKVIRQRPKTLKMDTMPIHRLSHQIIADGEPQEQVIDALKSFCADSVCLGHFFRIDLDFLDPHMQFPLPCLDTRKLALWLLNKRQPHMDHRSEVQLEKVCQTWNTPKFPAHHALGDALRTACLFLALQAEIKQAGIYKFSEVLKFGKA